MTKKPLVETLDQAIAAYGGMAKMARDFRYAKKSKGKGDAIAMWKVRGEVPRTHHLGLYLGLLALGVEPSPKLFGVGKWCEMHGWPTSSPSKGRASKLTRRKPRT
jgi:hypothetical protein